jgi:5-methyltetrahydrofolate--homocysteine methyltransferase
MDLGELLSKKVLIFDGSAGSYIQSLGVKPSDYRGAEGLGDVLCLYRPDIVEKMHEAYLEAGADIIETNTFNANSLSLSE